MSHVLHREILQVAAGGEMEIRHIGELEGGAAVYSRQLQAAEIGARDVLDPKDGACIGRGGRNFDTGDVEIISMADEEARRRQQP
jgi:hypothetical protein